jgi:ribonuclease Z
MAMLYILGSGTPTPTPERFGTSSVLQLGDDCLMFDCGPATTYQLVRAGLFPTQIDFLFFTHHHFDHNADYPCFLLCRWDQSTGRENRLHVRGPKPTRLLTERLIGPEGAFVDDWKARVNDPTSQRVHVNRGGSLPRPEPSIDVDDVEPGPVTAHGDWSVTAAEVDHMQPWLQTLAYRVECPGGSIVFAGDTGPCRSLDDLASGADVLVVNCWDHQQTMEENGEAPGQTGTMDAARMAKQAGARTLILTHAGPNLCKPASRARALEDIARAFAGKVIFAEEGMHLPLW